MLEAFLQAVTAVFILGCVAGIGYYSASQGWYDESGKKLVSKIVGITIPFYLFSTITSRFTHSELLDLLGITGVPFLAFAVFIAVSVLLCRLGLVRKEWQGTFIAQFSGASLLFVGIPVTLAMIGEKGIPYLLVYFIPNVIFIWTIGLYGIQLDGVTKRGGARPKLFSVKSLKMIFTKPLIGFLLGAAVVLIGLTVPRPIAAATKMIGQISSPLALVFIGITIYQIGFKRFAHLPREVWLILLGINVIKPVIMFFLTQAFDMDTLARQMMVIASAMPVSPMTGVLAKLHDGPAEFASASVGTSVSALVFTLPLIMMAVSFIR
ncbi:AEC family transporter [Mesosutterella sp. AGMB02718]|uniref:AEC family transporter n=1 Tax=Mesosutterella faecium TaxID=2925194 RepID=A0ABT7IRP5_9BURK|nr:AEC family transporter [Mesosutterella sp. AGMB02718]MDL2059976.1 AEC family transporter [Mesosutterella sp. AGMB02718]